MPDFGVLQCLKFALPLYRRHDQLLLNPPGPEGSKGRWS